MFKIVYKQLIIVQNSQAGFRKASLILYNFKVIILRFNINLQAVTPSRRLLVNKDL